MAVDVTKLPAPGKSGGGLAPPEPDADDAYGNDEDRAAEVSACQEFMDAAGLKGDAESTCDALKRFIQTVTGQG